MLNYFKNYKFKVTSLFPRRTLLSLWWNDFTDALAAPFIFFWEKTPKSFQENWRQLIGCFFFLAIFCPQNPDIFRKQTYVGVVVGCMFLAAYVIRKFGAWLPALCIIYFGWNTARVFAVVPSYQDWAVQITSQSFAFFITVTLIAIVVSEKQRALFFDTLALIAFAVSCWLIGTRFFTQAPYAFMNNGSADASILAVLCPVLVLRNNWFTRWGIFQRPWVAAPLALVPLVAIGCTSSSTGVAAACVACLVMVGTSYSFRSKKKFVIGLLISLLPFAAIPFFVKDHFLNDNGRHEVWKLMMGFWADRSDQLFGLGGGTFFYAGPVIQLRSGYQYNILFGFMHNEYLQLLWEQGYVGFALILATGLATLKRSLDRPWLLASLFTYGFIMLTQYPFRFFSSALIGALLVREAFETRKA